MMTPHSPDYVKAMLYHCYIICNEKKCSEETQTLSAGRSKAEPEIFAPS